MLTMTLIYTIIGLGSALAIFIGKSQEQLSIKLSVSLIIGAIWPIWLVAKLVQRL